MMKNAMNSSWWVRSIICQGNFEFDFILSWRYWNTERFSREFTDRSRKLITRDARLKVKRTGNREGYRLKRGRVKTFPARSSSFFFRDRDTTEKALERSFQVYHNCISRPDLPLFSTKGERTREIKEWVGVMNKY